MFGLKLFGQPNDQAAAVLTAIGRSQAVIEFTPDGTILTANENFLQALGYTLPEIQGKHHSMFVEPAQRETSAYQAFWAKLGRGEFDAAEYKRIAKGGREVWIQASYNPVQDASGRVVKVVKFATDITEAKRRNANYEGQLRAIDKAQAIIEFDLEGKILSANQNFLNAMGYSRDEIIGKHHSMFVEPSYRDSREYREFWAKLGRGEFDAAEYKRIAKGGREVWIQASYNPILEASGKPFKVVKFAIDVTDQKLRTADYEGQLSAIGKAMAVIEFELDGTIRTANDNFLAALGYSLSEIKGKHHSMFVDGETRSSTEYREFWPSLARGEFKSAEYKRIAKGGREIYIQASYNPILDLNGKPYKVVKFASDVTKQVLARLRSEHVSRMVESVASASEELNASVNEIAESMVKSRDMAGIASNQVQDASGSTTRLTEAAQSMGGIVDLISSITGQINLLALNATIESARAGEAGKGFAVVANEVKNLATQAKSATEQITREIDSMRGISDDVVAALDRIRQSIESVSSYVNTTAAAVQEQTAVTTEMSSNMQRVASEAAAMGA